MLSQLVERQFPRPRTDSSRTSNRKNSVKRSQLIGLSSFFASQSYQRRVGLDVSFLDTVACSDYFLSRDRISVED
jgi:hypothetical protein